MRDDKHGTRRHHVNGLSLRDEAGVGITWRGVTAIRIAVMRIAGMGVAVVWVAIMGITRRVVAALVIIIAVP